MIEICAFVSFASTKKTTVVEHVLCQRIQCPEIAFAGVAGLAWNLDKAIVKAEVVSDGVLPGGKLIFVVRKSAEVKNIHAMSYVFLN